MPQVKKVMSLQKACLDSITDSMSKSRNYGNVKGNLGVNSPFDFLRKYNLITCTVDLVE